MKWVFSKGIHNKLVVSNIFHFHPYLGEWSNDEHSFQMGWFNHQLGKDTIHFPVSWFTSNNRKKLTKLKTLELWPKGDFSTVAILSRIAFQRRGLEGLTDCSAGAILMMVSLMMAALMMMMMMMMMMAMKVMKVMVMGIAMGAVFSTSSTSWNIVITRSHGS